MRTAGVGRHAAELDELRHRVRSRSLFGLSAVIGLRLAVDLYSGPRMSAGLALATVVAVVLWLSLSYLPETARRLLAYAVGLLI